MDIFAIIKAAQYLNVPPWVLMEQPIFWRDAALFVHAAEQSAESQKQIARQKKTSA